MQDGILKAPLLDVTIENRAMNPLREAKGADWHGARRVTKLGGVLRIALIRDNDARTAFKTCNHITIIVNAQPTTVFMDVATLVYMGVTCAVWGRQ